MSPSKEAAINQFQETIDLERKVAAVVSKVLANSPHAIMIAWEDDTGVKATSIPYSICLVKGMVDTLFDMVFDDDGPDIEEAHD